MTRQPIRVLFVCLGNICRSPTAEAVLRRLVADAGLQGRVEVDSCGTGPWHVGAAPDSRAQGEARQRGYDMSPLRGRQFSDRDFDRFDYILAMDSNNLADLDAMYAQHGGRGTPPTLFLDFSAAYQGDDVPDPYYGDRDGFRRVFDRVEDGMRGLLADIDRRLAS